MRAELDLPPDLLHQAELEAERRGSTLDELMRAALTRELAAGEPRPQGRRTRFPIFGSPRPGELRITEADVRRAEEEDDLRRSGVDC